MDFSKDHGGGDLLDATVVRAGSIVTVVVARAASESFPTPESDCIGTLRETTTRVGGSEDADNSRAGNAREVQGAGVVRDRDGCGVEKGQGFEEGVFADEVGDGKMGEMGTGPGVGGAAGKDDFVTGLEQRGCEDDVVFDGPTAKSVIAEEIAGTSGDQNYTGFGRCR